MLDALPQGFVYLEQIAPNIRQEMRYASDHNLIGRPLKGYETAACVITRTAAEALKQIQHELQTQHHLSLIVYDCYRPVRAVEDLKTWSFDVQDQKHKAQYYPNIEKKDFLKLGYIAEKSSHSRGSTVDLSLYDPTEKKPLDMGTEFDFMDPRSHPSYTGISKMQWEHRRILKDLMHKHGFAGIETEWWHYTLVKEPYPDTYFDFVIQTPLKPISTS